VNILPGKLNDEQTRAVQTTDGAVLVLSGAGTGKTTVLIERAAYIINNALAKPWEVLAVTFTNKAANEMKERLRSRGIEVPPTVAGTFHSIALRILRYNSAAAGLRNDFLIFGEDEQKAVLKTVITNLNLDIKNYPPADWVDKISAIKDKGLGHNPSAHIKKIYDAYNAELARLGAVDFGDLILKTLELFAQHPEILEKYQHQFKYVMVDEYQDTNAAQYQLIRMLAGGHGNICCVGDDDQSIYSWRGAEIKNILNFTSEYPGAEIIRLETNYRSTGNILAAANSLIRHNRGRLGKDLRPAPSTNAGDKIKIRVYDSDLSESREIASAINPDNYKNTAILIRAGSLSRKIEEALAARHIPYRLVGATKFYDRMEIRDAIAYIRLLVYPFDDLSFLRIISKPRRGFGDKAIGALRATGKNLMDALRDAKLPGKQRNAADEFLSAFDFDWNGMPTATSATQLLENSKYMNIWRESKELDAPDRLQNINELITGVIAKYDSLHEFLEHAALMMTDDDQQNNSADAVSIMTMHAAKGLEFDTVFLPAWEQGIFPNQMAIDDGNIEEERRLAYVAITRARKHCTISRATSRMVFGKFQNNIPSQFIGEIDPEFKEEPHRINYEPAARQIIKPRASRPATMVGQLVGHEDLGTGVVIADIAGDDIVTVAFKDKGIKKVARKFLII